MSHKINSASFWSVPMFVLVQDHERVDSLARFVGLSTPKACVVTDSVPSFKGERRASEGKVICDHFLIAVFNLILVKSLKYC